LHKWIGTYNLYRVLLIRFFRWLYYPDIEQKKRPKPSIVDNTPQLKRKEKSRYKPTDLWTTEDDIYSTNTVQVSVSSATMLFQETQV
jgi:hypothetical protein